VSEINENDIRHALSVLKMPGEVFEIRALDARKQGSYKAGAISGYFDNVDSCIAELKRLESASGVYFTLNKIDPALLARRVNRLDYGGATASDINIVQRQWLIFDADPVRPSGISSTDEEKQAARGVAREIYSKLSERGWPKPIVCDSGNGWHLLYRIDVPAQDGGLITRVINGVADLFDTDKVKIDRTMFNPSRIAKLYGTLAAKGDATKERPHRQSRFVDVPPGLEPVSEEQLRTLADEWQPQQASSPQTKNAGWDSSFDMEEFLSRYGVAWKKRDAWRDGATKWELEQCPFCGNGRNGSNVFLFPDGRRGFRCQHNSCHGIGWKEFRAKVDTRYVAPIAPEAKPSAKNGSELQGRAVICPATEPWPEAVDGAAVLNEVAKTVSSYLALPDGAADAIALWIMHAHTYEAFIHSPRLNFRSPMKGCGKTLALDVVAVLTPRSLRTESITPAVLFRLVEGQKPTLLLDETDTYLKEADELRGLLNAGHKRGAVALRCEGESNTVRAFKAFAPAALAGIRELPGTLHDRAIVVELVRAKPREVRERFDSRRTDREMALRQKCARWAVDNFGALKDCDPRLPETAFNRLADNWRPLFAIAEVMGADWPKRASEAFAKLTSTFDLDAQGVSATLLADIAAIFDKEDTDKLPSAKLADSLVAIEGRPWAEWGRQRKPISPNQLANLLHPFGISPQVIRIGNETPRGYLLEQFLEQFDRYLPKHPLPDRNSATMLGKTPVSEVQHPYMVLHPGNGTSTRECCGVAPCAGGQEGKGQKEAEDRLVEEAKGIFNAVLAT
jgi:uncharacterized protein DUF3631